MVNIPDTDLPPLPEWFENDDLGSMRPSEIRAALREAQRQAYAKGIADFIKQHEGEAVAWMHPAPDGTVSSPVATEAMLKVWPEHRHDYTIPLFLAPQPQDVEAAVMAEREACAKFVTSSAVYGAVRGYGYMTSGQTAECLDSISAAIRARTTSPETRE